MFSSVLVANRGEIAVRIITTLRRLGIRAIAVCSQADADAPHVRLADAAITIGPAPPDESYLRVEAIVEAALRTGAEAVHPGYGFLSERAQFARACAQAGLVFVGPAPEAIERLGDKVAAKRLAAAAGVPLVPGIERPGLRDDEILAWAQEDPTARLPLVIKAAAGGGGRGMRVVDTLDDLPAALVAARREALAGFGDDTVLAERYMQRARHVEVQLLADAHGGAIHLGERECSLQRRHQKLVEECPSPAVSAGLRARMGAAAVALARAAGYAGAGTCEFLVPAGDAESFFFLEVNARLQVEHPVTELVYGVDLVEAQLRVAAGEPLWLSQEDVVAAGHAIEARICAEDAERGFLPRAGRIVAYREPSGPGIRVDSGVECGSEVSAHYDSLLAKVIAHAPAREQALERLDGALAHTAILGPTTNGAFLRRLLADPRVRAGDLDTGLVERLPACAPDPQADARAAIAAALARTLELGAGEDPWERLAGWRIDGIAPLRWRLAPERGGAAFEVLVARDHVRVDDGPPREAGAQLHGDTLAVTLDGERRVWTHARDGELTRLGIDGRAWAFGEQVAELRRDRHDGGAALEAPMPGSVLAVRVRDGDAVRAGDVLVVLESMKMELEVVSPAAGTVHGLAVAAGDRVSGGQLLVAVGGDGG
ncbi:MAG: acetyl-CoA/propionyl-CoA carboxylase, biotin carboxylase, biotin carboxyl carrier protein [Solirubrobacteraceae bacterium]|jgi:acetyl-CoA/propionyl-CoA carboxylase biotin carboxyl carrier protein|nr:acetyl-CoA/propionyl-CoA carboxylase, biotin carboxylase, biotin carboxyl carrier protein [Solirubrobacteraceae bacterium]